ncbi:cytochrome-c peroxidase [Aureispira anguillae]|uniref:Cytochrome-c peroxidase n=1 Tax=Aureispira anguillae TaxID=2864201 RepID=A0A915VJZ7_9BACT|nr:cytochrome c peroxidase [Aureispira anguillae]BDS09441.1 cytochrome-c peroxidase [Aureispira anguillae]
MQRFVLLLIWSSILIGGIMGCVVVELNGPAFSTDFPVLKHPKGNELTALRVELGRRLFYDPILSRDSTISCSSCHKQQYAFADNLPTSPGVEGRKGVQNAPSLGNIGYATSFTRAGGVPTLEMQILVPIQEAHEFDFNILLIAKRLTQIPLYDSLSRLAYNRIPDPFVITRSLAAFERTLLTKESAYDQYVYQQEKKALSKAAKRGLKLFMSDRTNCSKCHTPPHFSNFAFENNGLYEVYADSGRMRLTHIEADRALFKVPSLRNVALTAPYMHDGSMASLTAVVNHYNKGAVVHKNKNSLIKPLGLSAKEQNDLICFLEALTDRNFIANPALGNPN